MEKAKPPLPAGGASPFYTPLSRGVGGVGFMGGGMTSEAGFSTAPYVGHICPTCNSAPQLCRGEPVCSPLLSGQSGGHIGPPLPGHHSEGCVGVDMRPASGIPAVQHRAACPAWTIPRRDCPLQKPPLPGYAKPSFIRTFSTTPRDPCSSFMSRGPWSAPSILPVEEHQQGRQQQEIGQQREDERDRHHQAERPADLEPR